MSDLLGALIANQVRKGGVRAGAGAGSSLGGLAGVLGTRAGAALAGALAGMVFGSKKGRKAGGGLGRLGGLAMIGSLAWQAYQQWQASQGAATPPQKGRGVSVLDMAGSPFELATPEAPPAGSPLAPGTEEGEEALSRVLIRAMITAAKADGQIDAGEQAALAAELRNLPLSEADGAFILEELAAPPDVARVAEGARSPEIASAIYAASLLAITVDTAAERDYLAALAARLRLEPALVALLHANVDKAAPAA